MRSERIAVVGGGTMGVGIVYVFALAGFDVTLVEPAQIRVEAVRGTLAEIAEGAVKRGKVSVEDAQQRIGAIRYLDDAYDLPEGLDLVVETVPERIEIKRDVLRSIDTRRPDIIASNTSAISIDLLAENVSDPSRFLGMHFFNPVWSLQLVELIRGARTGADTLAAARDIAEALSAAGHPVQKAEILLTAPIRALGEYEVTVHLHAEVEATVKVQVKAEA